MVDSCRECASCRTGLEQYCEQGFVPTYNGEDRQGRGITFGGYSRAVVVDQAFVLKVPETLDPAAVAPLLCAGITTYSPCGTGRSGRASASGSWGWAALGTWA